MVRRRPRNRTYESAGAELLAVAGGGAIGAVLRRAVETSGPFADPSGASLLFEPILAVNVLGAALLGALLGHVERSEPHPLLRPFLVVGVLGSFTTYSTLVGQLAVLAADRGFAIALAKLALSLALGLGAFVAGEHAVRLRSAP